jgi:hypothetical protein
MFIEGTGIPTGTAIQGCPSGICSGTTISMTANATASGTATYKFHWDNILSAAVLQGDGKIVVVGRNNALIATTINNQGFLARLNDGASVAATDGTLDASFGTSGIYTMPSTTYGMALWTAMIDSFGRLVLGGSNEDGSFHPVPYITRVNP